MNQYAIPNHEITYQQILDNDKFASLNQFAEILDLSNERVKKHFNSAVLMLPYYYPNTLLNIKEIDYKSNNECLFVSIKLSIDFFANYQSQINGKSNEIVVRYQIKPHKNEIKLHDYLIVSSQLFIEADEDDNIDEQSLQQINDILFKDNQLTEEQIIENYLTHVYLEEGDLSIESLNSSNKSQRQNAFIKETKDKTIYYIEKHFLNLMQIFGI